MTEPHHMPESFRAALDAALARPLFLDPLVLDPLRGAAGFRPRAETSNGGSSKPPAFTRDGDVAIVTIEGPLAQRAWSCWMFAGDGYDAITSRVTEALADRATRAVVMRLDSPGGEVAGCFEAVRTIRAAAQSAGKPLVAYADQMACSAAYALASACDEILLPDTGMVGSVGVILSVSSHVERLKAGGVSVALITSGTAKADGHYAAPLSDDARGRFQADIDQLADLFAAEVATSRPLDASGVRALQARTFIGAEAVRTGLADHVGPFADAVTRARSLASTRPRTLTAQRAATRNTTMDPELAAAVAALTGKTDPAEQLAGLTAAKGRLDAAEGTIAKLSTELGSANDRAKAAEGRAEAMERAAEIEGAKAARQWTPALEGFLGTLSVEQLRTWRASAPAVVPAGEIPAPKGEGADAQMTPDIAALAAKGWKNLTAPEKHAVTKHDKNLAARLQRAV